MTKLLICHSCGKTFEFNTSRGGHVPTGCSTYCKNKIKRLAKRKKEKEVDSRLPTVQEALDWYNFKGHSRNLSGDPNMQAEKFSI